MGDRTCVECGDPVVRKPGRGRYPLRCPRHRRDYAIRSPNHVVCIDCREPVPRRPNARGPLRCGACKNTRRRRAYRARLVADGGRLRNQQRWYRLRSKFGIERDDYERLLAEQGGACASCGCGPEGERYGIFCVDHDHACCPGQQSCGGCVRGLICTDCNMSIGRMKDDPMRLRGAADYIERNRRRMGLALVPRHDGDTPRTEELHRGAADPGMDRPAEVHR